MNKLCKRCSTITPHYASNGACVPCVKRGYEERKAKRLAQYGYVPTPTQQYVIARQLAVERGERSYTGRPCKRCGDTERYASNSGCISCAADLSRLKAEANDARYRSMDNSLLWVDSPHPDSVISARYKLAGYDGYLVWTNRQPLGYAVTKRWHTGGEVTSTNVKHIALLLSTRSELSEYDRKCVEALKVTLRIAVTNLSIRLPYTVAAYNWVANAELRNTTPRPEGDEGLYK